MVLILQNSFQEPNIKNTDQIYKRKSVMYTKKVLMLVAWLKKTDFNTKVTEVEGKIPSITGLANNSALTAVENKIPDVSSLVKKTDYHTKISDIEKKITDHDHDK